LVESIPELILLSRVYSQGSAEDYPKDIYVNSAIISVVSIVVAFGNLLFKYNDVVSTVKRVYQ
jgi:hypothetical protein